MISLSSPSTKTQQIERIVLFEREETNVESLNQVAFAVMDRFVYVRTR